MFARIVDALVGDTARTLVNVGWESWAGGYVC